MVPEHIFVNAAIDTSHASMNTNLTNYIVAIPGHLKKISINCGYLSTIHWDCLWNVLKHVDLWTYPDVNVVQSFEFEFIYTIIW